MEEWDFTSCTGDANKVLGLGHSLTLHDRAPSSHQICKNKTH
jgi:hypothetical protein